MTITNTRTMICRRAFPGMLLGGILLIAQAASAQSWSNVATACVPDEASAGLYQFDDATVSFGAAAPASSSIKLRCNVPSPMDFTMTNSPPWTTLSVGYSDPDGGGSATRVVVQLVQAEKATGKVVALATLVSSAVGPVVGTSPIKWPAGYIPGFDYTLYEYYVAINLYRTNSAATPKVWFVGLD